MKSTPWFTYPFLLFPKRIVSNLEKRVAIGLTKTPPNAWQLSLGVMRMWHRSLFRSETFGTSPTGTVRDNWRARLLFYRPLRFPFLVANAAIAPFDLTGLASTEDRIIRHLLGAHHDGNQFVFDLELLSAHEGALQDLVDRTKEILAGDDRHSRWMQDLTVFEGYHRDLLNAAKEALSGIQLSKEDFLNADMSLAGYLQWCAEQPASPEETWNSIRQGHFSFTSQVAEAQA